MTHLYPKPDLFVVAPTLGMSYLILSQKDGHNWNCVYRDSFGELNFGPVFFDMTRFLHRTALKHMNMIDEESK